MNISEQIMYWKEMALADVETTEVLIDKNKPIESMFFCHLFIEKILKSHCIKSFNTIPPKTHNLLYLSENLKIELTKEQLDLLGILMKYQIEGRYPEYRSKAPPYEFSMDYLIKSKELLL